MTDVYAEGLQLYRGRLVKATKDAWPNLLRLERERRGWSQSDVADRIGLPDWRTVSRWERGVSRPQPHYRQMLCQVFDKTAQELGFFEKSATIWNVPFRRNRFFTGRDELLDQLHQRLTQSGQDETTTTHRVALTQPLAIKGLGGIGKTQTAIEYAYRYRDLYPNTLWVNAATEETLLSSFVAVAETLPAFPGKDEKDQRKLVEAVKQCLEQREDRWLLIFDNADDPSLVSHFLPQGGNGSILLTTRANALAPLAESIEVEVMGLMEGTQFLLRRTQREGRASDEEINEAANVVVALDHLPLALDQAGAYIEETQCSFEEYLSLYRTHRQALLAQRGTLSADYPHSVTTTWLLSFQKVQQVNPAAAELLELSSFLAPDRIPEELLRDGAAYWPASLQQAVADPLRFQQMIADLLKFSLVKRLVEDRALSIHRLVQAVQMDTMGLERQRQWAERVVRAVNEVFPRNAKDTATWPQCLRYLDQVRACNTLIWQQGLALIEAADLLNRSSIYLHEHALYAEAESFLQQALTINERELGPEHPSTAMSLNNLAALYQDQGKYEQAEPLLQRALAISTQVLTPEHPDVAYSLNNLANLFLHQGRYPEAESLYKQALAIGEEALGAEHYDMAIWYANLANYYASFMKAYEQAEPLFQKALAIYEKTLGSEHPDAVTCLNNLGTMYQRQGRYAEAERLHKKVLEVRRKILGPDHYSVAQSMNHLASSYREQGKLDEAEPLVLDAITIGTAALGEKHHYVGTWIYNLGKLYQKQGRIAEAEAQYKRAIAIWERVLPTDHPLLAPALLDLGGLLSEQGRYTEAEPLFLRARTINEKAYGPEHPDTTTSLNNLAEFYKRQGKDEQAEPLYKRTLAIREQRLGPEHRDISTS